MAWIPSHQELRSHPKTKKAARKAGCSLPQMIGHLHMLWWWSMDHAPDGDLSKFDAEDLADAVEWDADPDVFVAALISCGPADGHGFIRDDWQLHDWDEYGGKYRKRVASATNAANARWHSAPDASAMRPHAVRNATAEDPQCDSDAEAMQRRGEESREPVAPAKPPRKPRKPDPTFDAVIEACGYNPAELTKQSRGAINAAVKQLKDVEADPDDIHRRARAFAKRWPDITLTAPALAKHWPQLAEARAGPDQRRNGQPAEVGSAAWEQQERQKKALEAAVFGESA